jgi:hypothetical protein
MPAGSACHADRSAEYAEAAEDVLVGLAPPGDDGAKNAQSSSPDPLRTAEPIVWIMSGLALWERMTQNVRPTFRMSAIFLAKIVSEFSPAWGPITLNTLYPDVFIMSCPTIIRWIRVIPGKSISGPYNTPLALLKEFPENQPLASHIAFIVVSFTDRDKKRFAVYLRNRHFSSIIGRKIQLLAGHVKSLFQEVLRIKAIVQKIIIGEKSMQLEIWYGYRSREKLDHPARSLGKCSLQPRRHH